MIASYDFRSKWDILQIVSLRDDLDAPIHLTCTSQGCGGKPGFLKKTHADMGRMHRPHPDAHPAQELIFFPIVITKGL